MNPWIIAPLAWAAAYLVGAIPFGYLVARARGIDIFQAGSGNIGATNVSRVLGRKFGILVFVLDFAKGALPVLAAILLLQSRDLATDVGDWLPVGAGLAAFLGHLFPIYLRFRGGKGVATGAGVVTVLLPVPTIAAVLAWLTVVSATRMVSAGSLAAAVVLCVVYLAGSGEVNAQNPRTLFCLLAGALVFLRHRSNLGRIIRGSESRLPEGGIMQRVGRVLHVLALGLWFGMSVFFTFVVALSLFQTFETLGKSERPDWFPMVPEYASADEHIDGPREQGARVAGYAVGPLFHWYFLLQGVCGFVALTTALGWTRLSPVKIQRRRVAVLLVALATVVVGWPIERHTSALRVERNAATSAYLQTVGPTQRPAALERMKSARAEFGLWHTAGLFLNFFTVLLVTGGMMLAARLPDEASSGGAARGSRPGEEPLQRDMGGQKTEQRQP